MKLYFAGVNNLKAYGTVCRNQNVLTSYWELQGKKPGELKDFNDKFKFKSVFLDCGAYSAWTRGESIKLQDYVKYLKDNPGGYDVYPQLDVKGDIRATKDNLTIMEKQGLKPIPVFHVASMPVSYFKELVDKGYKYIALGAIAGEKGSEMRNLITVKLNAIFDYVIDKKTKEVKVKLHGFGITAVDICLKYPFYSVDSTSWLASGMFGWIYYFDLRLGKFVNGKKSEKAFQKMYNRLPAEIRNPKTMFGKGPAHIKRGELAIREFLKLEKYVTDIWEKRGVTFI